MQQSQSHLRLHPLAKAQLSDRCMAESLHVQHLHKHIHIFLKLTGVNPIYFLGICDALGKAGKNAVNNHIVQNDTVYGASAGAVKSFPERYFQYNTEKGIQRIDNIVKAKYGFFLK